MELKRGFNFIETAEGSKIHIIVADYSNPGYTGFTLCGSDGVFLLDGYCRKQYDERYVCKKCRKKYEREE